MPKATKSCASANPDTLPSEVRKILEEELVPPRIRADYRADRQRDGRRRSIRSGTWRPIAETTTFLLDSEDDVRRLGTYKALFIDTHGIRYLIPDTRALDYASRRILDRYF